MKRGALALVAVCLCLSATAFGENAATPLLHVGDSWVYRQTIQVTDRPEIVFFGIYTLSGAAGTNTLSVSMKAAQTKDQIHSEILAKMAPEVLWKVNPNLCGLDVVLGVSLTERPCGTALKVGDSWTTKQASDTVPVGSQFKVVRSEKITLPSGTFDTLVLEETGISTAKPGLAPDAAAHFPVSIRGSYWYDPKIKALLKKDVVATDRSGGPMFRFTDELQEFSVK